MHTLTICKSVYILESVSSFILYLSVYIQTLKSLCVLETVYLQKPKNNNEIMLVLQKLRILTGEKKKNSPNRNTIA